MMGTDGCSNMISPSPVMDELGAAVTCERVLELTRTPYHWHVQLVYVGPGSMVLSSHGHDMLASRIRFCAAE